MTVALLVVVVGRARVYTEAKLAVECLPGGQKDIQNKHEIFKGEKTNKQHGENKATEGSAGQQ